MGNTTELFKLGQPKASAYIGRATPTRPLEVTALNIPAGCQIQFDLVEYFNHLTKDDAPCGQIGDVYSSDRGRFPYTICDCKPFLDSKVQRLYIDAPGHYVAVIVPETGCLGKVDAYVREVPEMAGLLDSALRGCCGSSNPAYCASFRMDICGCNEVGFAYRDGDLKDPLATVAVLACDGTTVGWIYPTAAPTHTVPYYDGGTTILGYLANRSNCAPEPSTVINNYNTTNVAAPVVNVAAPTVVLPAPTVASQLLNSNDAIVTTLTDGTIFTTPLTTTC